MIPNFRAWDNDNNQWYKPTYRAFEDNLEYLEIGLNGRLSIVTKMDGQIKVLDESCFDGRFELMQSTGLRDKNGIEIYEGDIVKALSEGYCGTFQVKWRNEGTPMYILYPAWQNEQFWDLKGVNGVDDGIEVIGNVHEHSHLLDDGGEQQ